MGWPGGALICTHGPRAIFPTPGQTQTHARTRYRRNTLLQDNGVTSGVRNGEGLGQRNTHTPQPPTSVSLQQTVQLCKDTDWKPTWEHGEGGPRERLTPRRPTHPYVYRHHTAPHHLPQPIQTTTRHTTVPDQCLQHLNLLALLQDTLSTSLLELGDDCLRATQQSPHSSSPSYDLTPPPHVCTRTAFVRCYSPSSQYALCPPPASASSLLRNTNSPSCCVFGHHPLAVRCSCPDAPGQAWPERR